MNQINKIKVFRSVNALNESAAQFCLNIAEEAIRSRGRFTFCLSGGKTPKSLYYLLSSDPYKDLIPWKNTFLFWGDERYVPKDDERNNAHMAYGVLINKVSIPPANIFPIPVKLSPADAAIKYEETLLHFFGDEKPSFDLILLGLGENGHTASLFPNTKVLHENSHWVKEVYVEDQRLYRITMTAPLINMARNILFLVSGADKATILHRILTSSYQPDRFPVQLINPGEGSVSWFADDQAACMLPGDLVMRSN